MDERGVCLTASAATARQRSSAHLGNTLRSILMSPRKGFEGALATTRRRREVGVRPAEGLSAYVIAALGGTAAMLLWLKLGSLTGLRSVTSADFRWSFVVVAGVAGAVLFLLAQALWGVVGRVAFRAGGRRIAAAELRLVWGAAAFPQVGVLLVLLPLDLLIVGAETFTSTRLSDPLATGWAAISIALSLSLALWSLYLFARGVEVASGGGWASSMAGVMLALGCTSAVAVAAAVAVTTIVGS